MSRRLISIGMVLFLVSCSKEMLQPSATVSQPVENRGLLASDENALGQLFDAGMLGKFRVFYDTTQDYGLVLYWMPRVEKIGTKGLRENYCPTDDGFQFDATWSVPLQVGMYDATHDWMDPVAEFFPESEHTGSRDDDLFGNFCKRQIKDNPRPCSAFPLYDPNFENRKNFKYHNVQPGTRLTVLVSQPTLRARQIDARVGMQMFEETALYGLIPMCLQVRPMNPEDPQYVVGDPEAQKKQTLLQEEYLFPSDSGGKTPQYRFTLNMYHQIEDCQKWYGQVGLVPVDIPLSQEMIKPLPDDVRALSYHPQVSGAVCDALRQ